jgi:hypothetical protein
MSTECVKCAIIRNRKYAKKDGLPTPTRLSATCEICGINPAKDAPALHLDHCHETGKFRGWLCGKCNMGLGRFGDNIAGLERAVAYLRKAQ